MLIAPLGVPDRRALAEVTKFARAGRVLVTGYGAGHPGDPHFGFLRLRCECGEERLLPFSCKARGLCPSCGMRRAVAWAERMVEEVLPDLPYLSLVFTIPKILRKLFLFDRSL